MVQSIDLIFCKIVEIIEQNFFNRADFYLGPNFLFLARSIFTADDLTHIKSGNPIENANSAKVLFFVHRLNELDLRPLLDNFLIVNFFEFVFCL